jgi:L,D-transpeptidase YcbB
MIVLCRNILSSPIQHTGIFFLLFCFLSPTYAYDISHATQSSQATGNDAVREEIKKRIGYLQTNGDLTVQNCPICSKTVIPLLYERLVFNPAWTNKKSIDQLILVLETIDGDGLDSSDYHLPLIKDLWAQLKLDNDVSPSFVADFDLLLSDSLVRLGYHLLVGKVDPVELDINWNMDRVVGDPDQILQMATSIGEGSIVNLIQNMRPQAEIYTRLRSALSQYNSIKARGGWDQIVKGYLLKRGMTDRRVVSLRKRLIITNDLAAENQENPLFDQAVEEAVRHFQKRHGLVADGIVGNITLSALNKPVDERINQICVNLERGRWVLHDLPSQFVLVDIAGFEVRYLLDKTSFFETRAQVGTKYRKTPVFKSEIKFLVLNPTWTVPTTIFLKDILPKVKEDPEYLKERGLRVITYKGENVNEDAINWSSYPKEDFPYLLRQDPGPTNALGRLKFMFPNSHDVYLHDTPNKSLFENQERTFSSGCVRIENPFTFAELLLDDDAWTQEELLKVIDSKETRQISLNKPVTILLQYWTVTVGNAGTVSFKKDIYGRDHSILSGLNAQFTFRERPLLNITDF